MNVLVDRADLKLVAIDLRGGTGLPPHESTYPITIQALRGEATVLVGTTRYHLGSTEILTLPPKTPHSVELRPGAAATLLIHHLRGRSVPSEGK